MSRFHIRQRSKAARGRMFWLAKPLSIILLLTWLFNPAVLLSYNIETTYLIGFLLGSLVGMVFISGEILHYYKSIVSASESMDDTPVSMGEIQKMVYLPEKAGGE